jgi:hypothetical protein
LDSRWRDRRRAAGAPVEKRHAFLRLAAGSRNPLHFCESQLRKPRELKVVNKEEEKLAGARKRTPAQQKKSTTPSLKAFYLD